MGFAGFLIWDFYSFDFIFIILLAGTRASRGSPLDE